MSVNFGDKGNFGGLLHFAAAVGPTVDVPFTSVMSNGLQARGIKVKINLTSLAGSSPTVTVTIQGVDAVTGQKWTLLASAALASTGFTVLTVYPGAAVSANVSANDEVPDNLNIHVAFGGSNPQITGDITAELLP